MGPRLGSGSTRLPQVVLTSSSGDQNAFQRETQPLPSKTITPLNSKKGPLILSDPFVVNLRAIVQFLVLLNGGSLSSPDLPTSLAFDVGVSEASLTVKGLSFGVFPAHAVDTRDDRRVSLNAHIQI